MNWNILIGTMVVLAGLGGAAAESDTANDDPTDATYTNAGYDSSTDAADDADGDSDEAPVSYPSPRDVHRCVHKVDDSLHKAHWYGKHIKQQMRAIEHRVTMLEIKEMRLSNALEDIEVGEPIDENQTAKLEKILERAYAALEQDPGPRKEAYLMHVINRTEAALESGVWSEEDVEELEQQLERIQKMQNKLLHRYLALKEKLHDLRDRYQDVVSDRPCFDQPERPDKPERPDVRPVKTDVRPASDVRSAKAA